MGIELFSPGTRVLLFREKLSIPEDRNVLTTALYLGSFSPWQTMSEDVKQSTTTIPLVVSYRAPCGAHRAEDNTQWRITGRRDSLNMLGTGSSEVSDGAIPATFVSLVPLAWATPLSFESHLSGLYNASSVFPSLD